MSIYLLLEILPQRRRHDDERPVDEVDDAVGHRDVGLHDVGDDVLARVVPVALHRVRLHLNWNESFFASMLKKILRCCRIG